MIAHLDTFSEYTMKDTKIKKNKDTHTHKKKKTERKKRVLSSRGKKKNAGVSNKAQIN